MLLDLRNTELTGKVAQETLDQAHITVNKNTVPFETRSPFVTSGVRIGTPAVTTRGMKEPEMEVDRRPDRARPAVGRQRRGADVGRATTSSRSAGSSRSALPRSRAAPTSDDGRARRRHLPSSPSSVFCRPAPHGAAMP